MIEYLKGQGKIEGGGKGGSEGDKDAIGVRK
jgi:hypothetical protein